MLRNLRIENIAVIEKADIEFDIGLNVMTGETGAGKSIIIDSINAIMGERTSKELIRTGQQSASVSALFVDIGAEISELLGEFEVEDEGDGTLLIQRKINADGRNLCKINGCPVTVSMLKQLSAKLINIHGQHDSHILFSESNHCGLVDYVADNKDLCEKYEKVFRKYISLKKELKSITDNEEEKERKYELYTFQLKEIKSADIKPGELKNLTDFRDKCHNSEKIRRVLDNSYNVLSGNESNSGVILSLKNISDETEAVSDKMAELGDASKKINEAYCILEEVSSDIRTLLNSFDYSQSELEEAEERIDYLIKLQRKYDLDEQGLIEYSEKIKKEIENMELSDVKVNTLTDELNACGTEMLDLAEQLSASRKEASKIFVDRVTKELEFLDMPGVKLSALQQDKPLNSKGKDNIEFLFSANEGESMKPLSKVASGGELSRIMLAIKNVTTDGDNIGTMIFDEIDTGVSGKTAEKIGMKLSDVARGRQVICVTHSAQLASHADRHLLIEKSTSNGQTYTQVRELTFEGRKFELARIIGGVVITQGQLKVAEEMLKNKGENLK